MIIHGSADQNVVPGHAWRFDGAIAAWSESWL